MVLVSLKMSSRLSSSLRVLAVLEGRPPAKRVLTFGVCRRLNPLPDSDAVKDRPPDSSVPRDLQESV